MTPLAIVAAGARTPLGLGATASALLMRAGRIGLTGGPFSGRERDHVVAGAVPTMPWSSTATGRASSLLRGAIAEALAGMPPALAKSRVAVLMSVSTADADAASGGTLDVEASLRVELKERLASVEVLWEGEVGGADLAARAEGILALRQAEVVLWGGAHSDVAMGAIAALAATDRLYDARHLDAVVPGEAAGVVALVVSARARPEERLALLAGAGASTTEASPFDDRPVSGDAMTDAIRAAMVDGGEEAPAGWVLSDVGYEALRLREWEMVQVRARALLGVPYRWDALPQRFGRVGAAHLPLSAALTAASFALGHVPSKSVLAIAGTDVGRRGAVWLRSAGDATA